MDGADLVYAGIARQAELIRSETVSSRELVEACLARIDLLDTGINAFRVARGELSLAEADQADARTKAGEERPLLGVPVAIKDNVDMAGEVTTHGTRAHGGPATADAEVVARLRAAGAIPIGRTHLPELASWAFTESATYGMTRNPWSLDRTPGGSSGGSAAAVAAGMVGGALGSDGAGSIRIPAACCGLFGLKPQRDRIALRPFLEHWHGLSVLGPLTRTVADAALFLQATAGGEGGPPPPVPSFVEAAGTPPGPLRIAISLKAPVQGARVDERVKRPVHETADLLRSLGHTVTESNPDWGTIPNAVTVRYLCGIRDDAAEMAHPDRLERRTRGVARLGALIHPAVLERTRRAEAGQTARLNAIFGEHDVLMTPVLLQPPVEVGRWEGRGALATVIGLATTFAGAFTSPWNLTGQPAASVPAGLDADGVPQSVQLIGRPNDEATLLSLAAQLEAERPWAHLRPPLP